ncbi:MAG: aldehyde ferredoxin oxidoreductase N-terminal domain-containing protein, partial [Desulfatiglandales bacterium]
MYNLRPKLLYIDLTAKTSYIEEIPGDLFRLFIGGRGFGALYSLKEIPPKTEPLSEGNTLMFFPGILAGTPAAGFSKWMVVTKSPLTGTYARSVCGGKFRAAMNFMDLS